MLLEPRNAPVTLPRSHHYTNQQIGSAGFAKRKQFPSLDEKTTDEKTTKRQGRTTDDETTWTNNGRRAHDGPNDGRTDGRRQRRTMTTILIYSFISIFALFIYGINIYIYIYIYTIIEYGHEAKPAILGL